ncbi:MAG: site-specific integrase [Flavonifractor sp.]|jgi:integrase|nr:site-specific integrase [Flavonifractor sp.]
MTGSLQIKSGKFYMVLNIQENGKRKMKWISTGLAVKGNKRKAEQMLRETLQTYEIEQRGPKCDMPYSDYVQKWLEYIHRKVDEVTYQGYELLAQRQIIPWFQEKSTKLDEVSLPLLQEYIDEKATKGRADGKGGLSPRSLRLHKNILYQSLTEAVKDGLIASNPCQHVILPKNVRYESHFYTVEQLNQFFEAIRDEPLYPLLKITAIYGLRRSEVLGLKWDSIDFGAGTMTIRHTVSKVTKAVEKDKTKNATSYRSFPLTEEAQRIFQAAKAEEEKNRRLFGRQYQESDYVFKWADGRSYSPDYITSKFPALLKKHGMPHIRLHELRHSCASLLINAGFTLKDVQEWMGHADIKMTANIYGHLDVSRKQSMAEKLSGDLSAQC